MLKFKLTTIVCICSIFSANGYKAVLFMHGILGDAEEGQQLLDWIQQVHPGTDTYTIAMYEKLSSLTNMVEQVKNIAQNFTNYMNKHPDGIHLICFSQGGLICRGVLEQMSHNVDTFISLSSPQAGQFGDTVYMKYAFPNLLRDNIYKLAYTKEGQDISVGNYWNEYKENFLRLKKLVMIGGPDDGVITPWQSSHFGFFDETLEIKEMKNQTWYTMDSFGLQTLDKTGGLITYAIPGVKHIHWHSTKSVFVKNILPHLT